MDKDIKKLVRKLEDQGWRIERGAKHTKAWPPDKTQPMVTIPHTPSDHRALKNLLSELRRKGADV